MINVRKLLLWTEAIYENVCLDILKNSEYYEDLSYDPNDQYKQFIRKKLTS